MDQSKIRTPDDAPITNYYLWLPYLLSLLFLLCKLPHTAWKKYFENNLISQILAGHEENWDSVGGGRNDQGGGGGGNDQQGGKKNKNKNNQAQANQSSSNVKHSKPIVMAKKFIEYRKKYNSYQLTFAFWETFNFISVLASMQVTHWLLNNKFWNYGLEVIYYLNNYQGFKAIGQKLYDPMCEVFPTEVSCFLKFGGTSGFADQTTFLCILGNNMFNQKYFFLLWLWWVALLLLSSLGLIYRVLRIYSSFFSKLLLIRKVHGDQLFGVKMTSGDSFVLEMVVDNLARTPKLIDEFIGEVASKLHDLNSRKAMIYKDVVRDQTTAEGEKAPLLTTTEERDSKLNQPDQPSINAKDSEKDKNQTLVVPSTKTRNHGDKVDVEASKDKPVVCDSPPHYSFLESANPMDYGDDIFDHLLSSNIVNEKEIIKSQEEALAKFAEKVKASKKKNKSKKPKEQPVPRIERTSTPKKDEGNDFLVLETPSCPTEDDSIDSLAHGNLNDRFWF